MYAYCQGDPVNLWDPSGSEGMPWGLLNSRNEIHIAVQKYILANSGVQGLAKEKRIYYPSGKYGSADLANKYTGEVWEIKPTSVEIVAGLVQIAKYVSSKNKWADKSFAQPITKGRLAKSPSDALNGGRFLYRGKQGVDFIVSYTNHGNGVITYYFELADAEMIRQAQQQIKQGEALGIMLGATIPLAYAAIIYGGAGLASLIDKLPVGGMIPLPA
jgi:hypothetical protein